MIRENLYLRPFWNSIASILHDLGLMAGVDTNAYGPLRVSQAAASEQDLIRVDRNHCTVGQF